MATVGAWILGNETHVGEDIGVAHVIDARLARCLDDRAAGITEIDRHAVRDVARGMIGAHQGHREAALVGGAAGVHGIEFLKALAGEPHAQIVVRHHRRAGLLRNVEGIADVIAMAVDEHDVGHALDGRRFVGDEGGIAGEERIDQHGMARKIEPKRGMAEPGDLHDGASAKAKDANIARGPRSSTRD
jgi:hypothetical protein